MIPMANAGMRPLALAALLAATPTTAEAWRFQDDVGRAQAIAVDPSGDVAIAGEQVLKLSGADGTELWRDATGSSDVTIHPSGDVLVTGPGFGARRLTAATGATVWTYQIFGSAPASTDGAGAIATDAASAVVIAGALENTGSDHDFAVAKVDATTGAELWTFETTGAGMEIDRAHAVAVDASGDVFACGVIRQPVLDARFVVMKLDGATGAEMWRYESTDEGWCQDIALDSGGFPIAGGREFGKEVKRFDPATGAIAWEAALSVSEVDALTVDGSDDVFVAATDLAIVSAKVDGATGTEVWRTTLLGHAPLNSFANGIALDGSGDVLVAGQIFEKGHRDALLAKLEGTSGTVLWDQRVDGPTDEWDAFTGVVADASGDAFASGYLGLEGSGSRYLAVRADGATGILGPVFGKKLDVRDSLDPTRRKITGLLQDQTILLPAAGSASDPTLAGATVTLTNPTTAESATFALPPGPAWKALGNPAGSKGYKYTDGAGANGPCRTLVAKPNKLLKVTCIAKFAPIPFSLDEPTQGSLTLSVAFGGDAPHCGVFGGEVKKDSGVGHPAPVGRFSAKKAPAAGNCP